MVKAKKKVINLTYLEGVVNVINSSLLVVSGDILKVRIVRAKILIEHLDTVVTVATDKRIRKNTVHHSDCCLCICPLLIGLGLGVICVSCVNTVLGDVTKTENVLDVL